MEPVSAIALSLALGASAIAGKTVVSELVKDAYATLKGLIKSRYPKVSIEQLEELPESKSRRGVIEEDLAKFQADRDADLLAAAQKLTQLIQQQAPSVAASIGVALSDVEAANVRLRDIMASGRGVIIERAKVSGDIDIQSVRAGLFPADTNHESKKN